MFKPSYFINRDQGDYIWDDSSRSVRLVFDREIGQFSGLNGKIAGHNGHHATQYGDNLLRISGLEGRRKTSSVMFVVS